MKCASCGAVTEAGARFCGVCGSALPALDESRAATELAAGGDPFIGTVLSGRFRVEGKLGEGGFGAVYRGVQIGTGRKVALKLLHPEMTRDEHLVARFRREGLVLCNLRDAHTITTYDFDRTADGTLYIAMELLEGRSLQTVFDEEAPVAWRRVLRIVSQMCSSLTEAHAQGIVHRDLKPENIYLEQRGGVADFVKILDFGIAKVLRGDAAGVTAGSPQLTATGQTLGTLEYMSPEQLMGKELDGRSDIYTVGVVTYELITGRLPFPEAKGPAALITAQLRQTPEAPSQARPDAAIAPAVDAVVLRMLEKDKERRFADAAELQHAVDALLEERRAPSAAEAPIEVPRLETPPVMAAPGAGINMAPAPGPALGYDAPSTATALAASRSRSPLLWVVLAMLLVGCVVGVALALIF